MPYPKAPTGHMSVNYAKKKGLELSHMLTQNP